MQQEDNKKTQQSGEGESSAGIGTDQLWWHLAIGSLGQEVLLGIYDGSQSVILSPFLLHSTLTMALAGAEKETQKELETLLLFSNRISRSTENKFSAESSFERLRLQYHDFVFRWVKHSIRKLQSSAENDNFHISIEHSVVHAEETVEMPNPILGPWKEKVYGTFNAPMMPVPFARPFPALVHDKPAIQVLHELTSNPTKGLVKRILPGFPPRDTLLMLLNAVHFVGKWIPDSQIDDITAPLKRCSFFKSEKLKSRVARFPLQKNHQLNIKDSAELIIVRPDIEANDEVIRWLQSFTWTEFYDDITHLSEKSEPFPLPEQFEVESQLDHKETLQTLGLKSFFDKNKSVFTNLTNLPDVCFAQLIQKSKLIFDSNGVESASAVASLLPTEASLDRQRSAVKLTRIDKGPLYFAVLCGHESGMLPLFMGMLNTPKL